MREAVALVETDTGVITQKICFNCFERIQIHGDMEELCQECWTNFELLLLLLGLVKVQHG